MPTCCGFSMVLWPVGLVSCQILVYGRRPGWAGPEELYLFGDGGARSYLSFCLMFLTLRCKKKDFADSVLFSRINGGRTSVLVGEED